jgi:hypothetical protein
MLQARMRRKYFLFRRCSSKATGTSLSLSLALITLLRVQALSGYVIEVPRALTSHTGRWVLIEAIRRIKKYLRPQCATACFCLIHPCSSPNSMVAPMPKAGLQTLGHV